MKRLPKEDLMQRAAATQAFRKWLRESYRDEAMDRQRERWLFLSLCSKKHNAEGTGRMEVSAQPAYRIHQQGNHPND